MYGMAKIGWHGTRKRKNGNYQARWCGQEGLDSLGGFISKAQAEAYALRMANEALNVKVGLAVYRKPIAEARREFLERRTKPNTRALNERRIDEFLRAMPEVRDTSQLTRNLIDRYALILEGQEHNPGGQEHHLRIVRAFCNFCLGQKWITESPFKEFKMPKSEFAGRELSADEWAAMVSPSKIVNQHKESDYWLNRAFCLGHSTMLRISQVWKLTPEDFRAPDQLRVLPIKGQEPVWITLRDDAAAILAELLPGAQERGRFFFYWASVESMRNSVQDKARRVGLSGVRFHDVCKVTRISQLSREGYSPAELEHLANTSKKVLVAHYMRADRRRAFERYKTANLGASPAANLSFDLVNSNQGHTRATIGPKKQGFVGVTPVQSAVDRTNGTNEIVSTSQPIPA